MGDISRHFSRKEFECKCGCKEVFVDAILLRLLEAVRDQYGMPIIITSGYRCEKHNTAEGGKPGSAHLKGKAVDILTNNSRDRYLLIKILINKFSRIGTGHNFIHVDVDETKPQHVCWVY